MRKRPNVKADWVQVIERGRLVEDLGANPNWITAKVDGENVYISKSVMVKESA